MKSIIIMLALIAAVSSPAVALQDRDRIVIQFAADSDEVPASAAAELARFARAHPDQELTIEGHATLAESENSEGYARGLSQRRAAEVRTVIWNDDVARRQYNSQRVMTTLAQAADRPLDGVPPGHGRNRRVEVALGGPPGGW
jgi:outer membrane protein OmpA-like peptidoglycan-associated protein